MPSEFVWQAKDGSRVVAVCLKHWYNNAQHIPEESGLANLLLDINEKNFEGFNVTPYILLMNGVDHLEPQEDVTDIVAALRREGRDIRQTSLDEYVSRVREYLSACPEKPLVYEGAIDKGVDEEMLKGCRSSRIYLKRENVRAEDLLLNQIEPLYACLETDGLEGACPKEELAYLWKQLMKNHPHDSICGCSCDDVSRDMERRFAWARDIMQQYQQEAMRRLAAQTDTQQTPADEIPVQLFHLSPWPEENAIQTFTLRLPADTLLRGLAIRTADGQDLSLIHI